MNEWCGSGDAGTGDAACVRRPLAWKARDGAMPTNSITVLVFCAVTEPSANEDTPLSFDPDDYPIF